jgi:hypothetical protein
MHAQVQLDDIVIGHRASGIGHRAGLFHGIYVLTVQHHPVWVGQKGL